MKISKSSMVLTAAFAGLLGGTMNRVNAAPVKGNTGISMASASALPGIASLAAPGTMRVLTRNGLEDHTPMFSADGKTVVFRTRFPFEKTDWTLTTARALPASK